MPPENWRKCLHACIQACFGLPRDQKLLRENEPTLISCGGAGNVGLGWALYVTGTDWQKELTRLRGGSRKSSNLGRSSVFIWPQQLTLKRKKNNNGPPNPPKIQLRVNSKWNLALLEILAWIKIPQKSSWLINLSSLSTDTCMKKPWWVCTMNVYLVRSNGIRSLWENGWNWRSSCQAPETQLRASAVRRHLEPLSSPVLRRNVETENGFIYSLLKWVCASNVLPPCRSHLTIFTKP